MTTQKPYNYSEFMQALQEKYPHQEDFLQAVAEVLEDVIPFINKNPRYAKNALLGQLIEPEQEISFRVTWQDDKGDVHVNRGYRVQFSSAIGPYKGGLRFHPTVTTGMLKFLAFEQTFKNSLTGLPLGAGKGGSDFNPKGRSNDEIRRFCRQFMLGLYRHIGPAQDIPAGDMGVGEREIGYLFGMYQQIVGRFEGSMSGKGLSYGGSAMRTEATGYGLIHIAQRALAHHNKEQDHMTAVVSGAGNVALHAAEKLLELGVTVLTLSDTSGMIYTQAGLTQEQIEAVKVGKKEGKSLKDLAQQLELEHDAQKSVWSTPCDLAFPCATQNELTAEDAKTLIDNGCKLLAEGANMPSTAEAAKILRASDVIYIPGKAANAGGVAVSGLEMAQNASHLSWSREDLAERLETIMHDIHDRCVEYGAGGEGDEEDKGSRVDYVKGANIAGFIKVADAMLAAGF